MQKRANNEVRTDYLARRIIILVIFDTTPKPYNRNSIKRKRTGIRAAVVFKLLDLYYEWSLCFLFSKRCHLLQLQYIHFPGKLWFRVILLAKLHTYITWELQDVISWNFNERTLYSRNKAWELTQISSGIYNSPTPIGCFIAWAQFSVFWTWVSGRPSVWRDFWDAWSISPLTPSATRWRHPLANPFPCPSDAGRASPERLFSRKLRH